MNTIDLVRLYKRGTPAQKLWTVVLLLAVKDGATRVWYDPAKGESRLGYEIGDVEHAMVPPPKHIEAELTKMAENLVRRRSALGFLAGFFGGSTVRSSPLEGSFVAKFEGQRVTVSATVDLVGSCVMLRPLPESSAAPAAHAVLKSIFGKYSIRGSGGIS